MISQSCEVPGCGAPAGYVRVSRYHTGASLYVCELHWGRIRLEDTADSDCYATLPEAPNPAPRPLERLAA